MKPERISPRIAKIPARINGARWAAYAAAGAATALAGVKSAEAASITYSGPINQVFNAPPNGSVLQYFQLDQPGDTFALEHIRRNSAQPSHGSALFGIRGIASAGFAGFTHTFGGQVYGYASKLGAGQNVSTRPFFVPHSSTPGYLAAGNGFPNSQWLKAGTGFIGFEFNSGSGTGIQYGWARITIDGTPGNSFTLRDYAFADPGQQILTGQTSVPDSGSSLGLLALGAAGLLALRMKRAAVVS